MIRTYVPSDDDSIPETDERLARCLIDAMPEAFDEVTVRVGYCSERHLRMSLKLRRGDRWLEGRIETCRMGELGPETMQMVARPIALTADVHFALGSDVFPIVLSKGPPPV